MSPAVNEIMSSGGDWGSTWDDFNKLHQRLLTDFHRDFFTSSFDNSSSNSSDNSVQIKNEKDKFIVTVDSSDFNPEELKVSTFDNVLKIEGKHIEESGNGSGNCSKYVSRQFSRSYTLPADCKVTDMTSSFGSGKLTVNVPKSRPAIEEIPSRSIPISVKHEPLASKESGGVETAGAAATPSVGEPSVRQVKISHHVKQEKRGATEEKAESMTSSRTSSPTMSSASKSPEPPMTSIFDMDRGSSLFHRWVRPIQLFDEDFFVDSFWKDRSSSNSAGADLDGWMQPSVIRSNVGSKVQVNDNDQRFEFIVPTDDYEPQELKVTVLDDVLKIEGKHIDEQSEEGEGVEGAQRKRKSVSKQFSRSYVLPKHVYKMDQVESCLTKAKNLVVKVPKIQPKTNAFNVPIKML